MAIKMICFDMDGTLLTYDKRITEKTMDVLRRAGQKGILLVPATGRLPKALDQRLLTLPGMRYAICINGALVYDYQDSQVLHRAEVSLELAHRVYRYLDTLPVIYDCFADNVRYTGQDHADRMEAYIPDPHIRKMVYATRVVVPEMHAFLRERGGTLQKLQAYFRDPQLRLDTIAALQAMFPELSVTTSLPHNCEINDGHANKGEAMEKLCALLGIDPQTEVLSFGDGSNDRTLLQRSGFGVAMENAEEELKAVAKYVTQTNDQDGVARGICRFCDLSWDEIQK